MRPVQPHRPAVVAARALVSYRAMRQHGLTPTAVAAHLGISRRRVSRAFERAQQLGLDRIPELNSAQE